MDGTNENLGDILLKYNLIEEDSLKEAQKIESSSGGKLGEILIEKGFISEDDLFWAMGNKFSLPYINLSLGMIDLELLTLFPREMLQNNDFLPLVKFGNELTVCVTDPTNAKLLAGIEDITQCKINVSLCSYSDFKKIKEQVIAKWEGKEINYERVLVNFFEPVPESTVNGLLKDESMSAMILFIFDEMVRHASDSMTLINSGLEIRVFMNFKGLRTLKMRVPGSAWKMMKEKLLEFQRLSGGENIVISRDINYVFSYNTVSDNCVQIRNVYKLTRVASFEQLGLTHEQKIMLDNVIPFKKGLCVFSSKDKSLSRKIAYNILNFHESLNVITVKLDNNVVLEGFDNIINFEQYDDAIKHGDFDVLVADDREIGMADLAYLLEQGKLVLLIAHTSTSREWIDYYYTHKELYERILPHIKLLITSVIVPKLCDACKKEVNFSLIPTDIFSFYKDVKFYEAGRCEECKFSGYVGFKEFNELLYIDNKVESLLKDRMNAESIFATLKSSGFIGIRDRLFELAKGGEIPYYFLI